MTLNLISDVNLKNYYTKTIDGMFICTLCSQESKHSGTLRRHIRNRHFPVSKIYPCDKCHDEFSNGYKLRSHKKLMHEITVTNYNCGVDGLEIIDKQKNIKK